MSTSRFAGVVLIAGTMIASALGADVRALSRPLPEKSARTVVVAGQSDDRVMLKIADTVRARWRGEGLVSESGADLSALLAVLVRAGARVEPLVDGDEARLEALRRLGEERTGRALPDMASWFELALPGADAAQVCDALNGLDIVDVAYPAPLPAPPPGNLPPETSFCESSQGYLRAAPAGIDADFAWNFPGGRGENVFLIDVEYDWFDEHEDLERARGRTLVYTPRALYEDHGTAVLGELVATDDRWGVTGLVPDVDLGLVTQYPAGLSNSVARAILAAADLQSAGDVLLIEAQAYGPTSQYVPVEWNQAEFDAIVTATAKGITVIEAAGNGGENLDGPAYLGRFDRAVRDSGAILVGAGYSPAGGQPDRSRKSFSCYGSRLDVQGWGENVATTGYAGWCGGVSTDPNQRYRSDFSGTSSAAPHVAAAAAALQGVRAARGEAPLAPLALRALLVETGTPQQPGLYNGPIGPRPDLRAALRAMLGGMIYESHALADLTPGGNGDGAADPGETLTLTLCLHNAGASKEFGVAARLVNPNPAWLKIVADESASFGDLDGGETACSATPHYSIVLEPDAPCGEAFHLGVEIASSSGVTASTLRFSVGTKAVCAPRACSDPEPAAVGLAFTLAPDGADGVRFAWGAVPGADGYRIWRAQRVDFADERVVTTTPSGAATTVVVPGERDLLPGLTWYLVRAINACGWEGP